MVQRRSALWRRPPRVHLSKWSSGKAAGQFRHGETVSRPENRKLISPLSGNAHTLAGHWDHRNSLQLLQRPPIALLLRKREAALKRPSLIQATEDHLRPVVLKDRETSRLSPGITRGDESRSMAFVPSNPWGLEVRMTYSGRLRLLSSWAYRGSLCRLFNFKSVLSHIRPGSLCL